MDDGRRVAIPAYFVARILGRDRCGRFHCRALVRANHFEYRNAANGASTWDGVGSITSLRSDANHSLWLPTRSFNWLACPLGYRAWHHVAIGGDLVANSLARFPRYRPEDSGTERQDQLGTESRARLGGQQCRHTSAYPDRHPRLACAKGTRGRGNILCRSFARSSLQTRRRSIYSACIDA